MIWMLLIAAIMAIMSFKLGAYVVWLNVTKLILTTLLALSGAWFLLRIWQRRSHAREMYDRR